MWAHCAVAIANVGMETSDAGLYETTMRDGRSEARVCAVDAEVEDVAMTTMTRTMNTIGVSVGCHVITAVHIHAHRQTTPTCTYASTHRHRHDIQAETEVIADF